MNPYDYPVVFFGGMTYVLERTKVDNGSFFGGGYEKEISGLSYGPRNLHHIFTLNGNCCAPIRKTRILDGIPLLYGLCFSGCRIAYRFDLSGVDILDMAPRESSVSWPYENYPDELPFFIYSSRSPSRVRMTNGLFSCSTLLTFMMSQECMS